MTERRVLLAALVSVPVLGTIAAIDWGDFSDFVAALGFVAAWTVVMAIFAALAWADLRRPGSRGWIAFLAGLVGLVLSLSLLIAGSPIVLPGMCLAMVAASLRHAPARLAVSGVLLPLATLIFVAALVG